MRLSVYQLYQYCLCNKALGRRWCVHQGVSLIFLPRFSTLRDSEEHSTKTEDDGSWQGLLPSLDKRRNAQMRWEPGVVFLNALNSSRVGPGCNTDARNPWKRDPVSGTLADRCSTSVLLQLKWYVLYERGQRNCFISPPMWYSTTAKSSSRWLVGELEECCSKNASKWRRKRENG